jgi:hypothetical protein
MPAVCDVEMRAPPFPILIAILSIAALGTARAQTAPQTVVPAYADFFTVQRPGELSVSLFGGGFRSDKYATTQQGFELEQSITPYIGAVGRVTGYELYVGQGFADPLDPENGHSARLNFVRLQGGLDVQPYPLWHLYLLGGSDAGDSSAAVVETDFSGWVKPYSRHPVNISGSVSYDYENHVTNSEIDLRTVVQSREKYMLFAGAGGAIFGGGNLAGTQGQGGPALGGYFRPLQAGLDVEAGYGSSGTFVQVGLFKVFAFQE